MREQRLNPRRTPAQDRSRATTAAILGAAARIFAEQGYAGGTTNHIAARAGVSVGSLYEYFPNKDAILVALVEAHVEESTAALAEVWAAVRGERLPLATVVRRFVEAMVALHARDPALHRVLFEEAPLPRRLRATLTDVEAAMATAVEGLLRAAPDVTVPDPALAARMVIQVVESLTHRLVLYAGPRPDAARVSDEIVRLVTRYLTGTSPRR